MDLMNIFDRREKYKRDIALLEKIYEGYDIKIKTKKIHEEIRKIYPVLEFEGEGIEKFNEILEKMNHAKDSEILTNIGYTFIFPFEEKIKKKFLEEGYRPVIISPFPNNLRYEFGKINKNCRINPGDYIFIKKGFVKIFIEKTGIAKKILYIEDIDKIDKVKAYKISKNLLNDFIDKIYGMLPAETERTEGEKIAASILSASNGMGLFSVVNNRGTEGEILKIYNALQNSLPEIFREEKICLNFNLPYVKNTIKVELKSIPLFKLHNFFSHSNFQYSLWFENAHNNQTISSPVIFAEISEKFKNDNVLSMYRNANIINYFSEFFEMEKSPDGALKTKDIKEEPIYDEEIQYWIISQRNLHSTAFENYYVDKFFKENFLKVIEENLNIYLPEGLPENVEELIVENTIVKEGFRRGFEGYCRKGELDNVENAKNFIRRQLKEMSEFSIEFSKNFEKYIKKRTAEGQKIYDLIEISLQIAGRVPYDDLVKAIKNDLRCDEGKIRETIEWILKKQVETETQKSPPFPLKKINYSGIYFLEYR